MSSNPTTTDTVNLPDDKISIASACECATCRPITFLDMRMILCSTCGNKRCPKAHDHRNICTNSNATGQRGSSYS